MTVWPNSLQSKHGAVDMRKPKSTHNYEIEITCGYTRLATTTTALSYTNTFVVSVVLGHMTSTNYIMYTMYNVMH